MGYSYSEHISDIGIRASAATLEGAFEQGAEATLNVMFGLDTIDEKVSVEITAEASDIELLFVEVLNEALSLQSRDELALKRLKANEIKSAGGRYRFSGTAYGEPFDREKHEVRTEVKGATYSGLFYIQEAGEHVLHCILDV